MLLVAQPSLARATCPDVLLGDSLAVGMASYARQAGFLVIARNGAGLAWLQDQTPRCASRLVLMFGTNDLRGLRPDDAEAYLQRIAEVMARWPARRIIWATPGCFRRDRALEEGSQILDRTIRAQQRRSSMALRHLPAVNYGRRDRCTYESADGIHPTAAFYRSWWSDLLASLNRNAYAAAW